MKFHEGVHSTTNLGSTSLATKAQYLEFILVIIMNQSESLQKHKPLQPSTAFAIPTRTPPGQ